MENSFCNSAVLLPLPLGIKVWSKWNVYSERHVAFLKKKYWMNKILEISHKSWIGLHLFFRGLFEYFFFKCNGTYFQTQKKEYLFAKNCNFWYNWCEGFDWYIYNKLLPFLYIYLSLFPIYIHEERGLVLHLNKFKLKSKPKATLCKVF